MLFGFELAAQSATDTIFFTADWKEISRADASFYRTFKQQGDTYQIFDHYKNGQLQMTAFSKDVHKLNKSGETVYYNNNGSIESKGFHKDNNPSGHWTWYYYKAGKDSSIADYNADGTKTYTHMCASCQVDGNNDVYTIVEEMPDYPGGINALMYYIQKNINYPIFARNNNIGGKVTIKFVITKTGELDDIQVIKSAGLAEFDQEAVRVVKSMPKWKPGKQGGDPVNVYFNLPINYSLADPYFVLNADDKNDHYVAAKNLLQQGKFKETLAYYIDNASENDIDFIYNRGIALCFKKDYKSACTCFDKVIQQSGSANKSLVDSSKKYLEKYCN